MSHLCLLNPVALAPNGIGTRDNASVPETMAVYPRQCKGMQWYLRQCKGLASELCLTMPVGCWLKAAGVARIDKSSLGNP